MINHDPRKTPISTGFCIFATAWSRTAPTRVQDLPLTIISEITALKAGEVPCYNIPLHWYIHAHDDHEINLIECGSARILLGDDGLVDVSPGQVIILPSGAPHRLIEISPCTHMRGLYVHPDVFHPLAAKYPDDPLVQLLTAKYGGMRCQLTADQGMFQAFTDIFEQAQTEYGRHDEFYLESLATLGHYTALLLARAMKRDGNSLVENTTARRVLLVKAWIDRHYLNDVLLQELAEMAQLSPKYFCSLFHELVGIPPKAYLTQRRINHAANLLAHTNLPIMEVAIRSGFESKSCFNEAFKACLGIPPSEYRNKPDVKRNNQDDKTPLPVH